MNLHNDAVLANIMVKLCKGTFLAGEAVSFIAKGRHYITVSIEGKKTMSLHNDAVLANIIVNFTSRNYEDSVSCIVHKLSCQEVLVTVQNCMQIKSLLKMQRPLSIRIYQNGIHVCIVG